MRNSSGHLTQQANAVYVCKPLAMLTSVVFGFSPVGEILNLSDQDPHLSIRTTHGAIVDTTVHYVTFLVVVSFILGVRANFSSGTFLESVITFLKVFFVGDFAV